MIPPAAFDSFFLSLSVVVYQSCLYFIDPDDDVTQAAEMQTGDLS